MSNHSHFGLFLIQQVRRAVYHERIYLLGKPQAPCKIFKPLMRLLLASQTPCTFDVYVKGAKGLLSERKYSPRQSVCILTGKYTVNLAQVASLGLQCQG